MQPWHDLCDRIVDLLEANKYRATIDNELEVLDHTLLKTREERFCAVGLLTHLGAAYINDQNYGVPAERIPPQLAVPWYRVCEELHILPTLTDFTAANCNWSLHDQSKGYILDNLKAIVTLTRHRGYEWFMMIPVSMEMEFGPLLLNILTIHYQLKKALENETTVNDEEMKERWSICIKAMKKMVLNFMRMREHLDPMDFYHGMRPYLAGSYNNPGLPNGLIYEGISNEGKRYIGGSAAQSCMAPFLDAIISVHHQRPIEDYNKGLNIFDQAMFIYTGFEI